MASSQAATYTRCFVGQYVMVVAVYNYCLVCVFLPASLFLHVLAMHHGTRSFSLSSEVIV